MQPSPKVGTFLNVNLFLFVHISRTTGELKLSGFFLLLLIRRESFINSFYLVTEWGKQADGRKVQRFQSNRL